MFLLNNLHDRPHASIYAKRAAARPFFDISDKQLNNAINSEWLELQPGSIACVVSSSRKMSLLYVVREVAIANNSDTLDPQGEGNHVLWGDAVARFSLNLEYPSLLTKYSVTHARLPNNVFSIGFNVANLGSQLDQAEVDKSKQGFRTLGDLRLYHDGNVD